MVDVRIRHEYDPRAQKVGEAAFDEAALDQVIPLLGRWGVLLGGDTYDSSEMVGQFVVTDSGAYFEVMLCAPDE